MDHNYFPKLVSLSLNVFYENLKAQTENPDHIFAFANSIFLPEKLSETLLTILSTNGILNYQTLGLFEPTNTRLRILSIPDASRISNADLKIFKKHKLKELRANNLKPSIDELVNSLNEWTRNNLQKLNVSKAKFTTVGGYSPIKTSISLLTNLRDLDLSFTNLNVHLLDVIVEDLPVLESLNISYTAINDITPLLKCKFRLKTLIMSNVNLLLSNKKGDASDNDVLFHLEALKHLDISFENCSIAFNIITVPESGHNFPIADFVDKLPDLVSLDVSGGELTEENLLEFLRKHKNLKFLGLLDTEVCNCDVFLNPRNSDYRADLQVTGSASLEQIILSLKLYSKRRTFLQNTLYSLYSLTNRTELGPRPDLIQLLTNAMKMHAKDFKIQLACSACLYNLTKIGWLDEESYGIPSTLMSEVAQLTLDAMNCFPTHSQLQKNALLTLCNDRILQNTNMDRVRCAKLVLNALCTFREESMQRLCVAISSIVVAKISTEQMTELGSQNRYMKELLALVRRKLDAVAADTTLGFALSTLWNITDESPQTCIVFLEEGGLELFTQMLEEYLDCDPVLTKILGLLNNIAEFSELRTCLMKYEVINPIRNLLGSDSIENSYFSAGVLANLVSTDARSWTVEEISRESILNELSESILHWKHIDGEMVAYRSFRPFLPLLNCYETYQAQLWALWAVQHVLTVNAARYYRMVHEEKLSDMFTALIRHHDTNPLVKKQAAIILNQLHFRGRINYRNIWSHPGPNLRDGKIQ